MDNNEENLSIFYVPQMIRKSVTMNSDEN